MSTSLKLVATATANNEMSCEVALKWIFEAEALKGATRFINWVGSKFNEATGFCIRALDSAIFPDLLVGNIAATKCSPIVAAVGGLMLNVVR